MRCLFRYLEEIITFLTRNAYIEIGIKYRKYYFSWLSLAHAMLTDSNYGC